MKPLLIGLLALSAFGQTKPQATQLRAPAGPVRVLVFTTTGGAQLATFDSTIALNNGVLSCSAPAPAIKTVAGVPDSGGAWMLPDAPSQLILFARNGIVMDPGIDYTIGGKFITLTSAQGFASEDSLLAVYIP